MDNFHRMKDKDNLEQRQNCLVLKEDFRDTILHLEQNMEGAHSNNEGSKHSNFKGK